MITQAVTSFHALSMARRVCWYEDGLLDMKLSLLGVIDLMARTLGSSESPKSHGSPVAGRRAHKSSWLASRARRSNACRPGTRRLRALVLIEQHAPKLLFVVKCKLLAARILCDARQRAAISAIPATDVVAVDSQDQVEARSSHGASHAHLHSPIGLAINRR
jgi:hypothetical protein